MCTDESIESSRRDYDSQSRVSLAESLAFFGLRGDESTDEIYEALRDKRESVRPSKTGSRNDWDAYTSYRDQVLDVFF